MSNRIRAAVGAAALVAASLAVQLPPAVAAPTLAGSAIALQQVASGLAEPTDLAWRNGDSRMYVAEQHTGKVRIVNTNHTLGGTVLTLSVPQSSERGLLGIVFSNDGTKLYVDYNSMNGDIHIVEYTMSGDTATSPRELLVVPHSTYANHNGGDLKIGPDGDLYVAVGDGGGGGDPLANGQDTNALLGKILRIDPAGSPYAIPSDNPFHGVAGKKGEIWMYGLRNPWRFSFDRANGEMWIADVGQDLFEEVDHANPGQRGTNWGWNRREGLHPYQGGARPAGALDPLFETLHSAGNCAIIGGYVYRGNAIPTLRGAYLYTDFCRSQLVGAVRNGNLVIDRRDMGPSVANASTFGEDNNGELYVASLNGSVYKIVPGAVQPVGYWHAASDGRVFGFHNAPSCNATVGSPGADVVGIAGTPFGYWTAARAGAISACRVPSYGSMAGRRLNNPIVGIAATPSGRGYWLVAADGGIFTFGDARYYGSTGALRLKKPIVGMAPTPTGRGYWLVAADGGVFTFGDAQFHGSTGAIRLAQPVVGTAPTPSGKGYWLVAADGGVFTFGDAPFYGSAPSRRLRLAVTGIAASPTGKGYWMAGALGTTLAFGDARDWGGSQNAGHPFVTGIAHN